jgi:hypothetical protein
MRWSQSEGTRRHPKQGKVTNFHRCRASSYRAKAMSQVWKTHCVQTAYTPQVWKATQAHTPMTQGVQPSLTPQSQRVPPVHLFSCQYSAITPTQLGQRWLLAAREKQVWTAWDLVSIVRLWGTRLGPFLILTGPLW